MTAQTFPDYGACNACHRAFVDEVTDPATQCRHDGGGYCAGDNKWATRTGLPPEERYKGTFRPGEYRCPRTLEQTIASLEKYFEGRNNRLRARQKELA